jgi:hypothetical protein
MMQNHSKTRLRMGLSNPPKKVSERSKTPQASGGEIQSILFAGFGPGSHPPAGHADNQDDHAHTGQHQQKRNREREASGSGGLALPD